MSTLQQTLENHAFEFATAIITALRGARIDDLMAISGESRPPRTPSTRPTEAPPRARRGRLIRRSVEDIGSTLDKIVAVLSQHPEGLRAEQIKAALQLDTREVPRPLAEGLKSGALSKKGQKRGTTYFAGGAKKRTAK